MAALDDSFVARRVAEIAEWHGVTPPNPLALLALADLAPVLAEFVALRGQMAFEYEPSSFEAALAATRDPG
ncbi:hypothetical protein ACQW02_21090 [Humitalea sp. 24SJ18S-53]|uniref:hypothetical protein n=1 Tax=Humitalea sp. 24SJ18S-53 TaxID=3422307 RepID=UPI003D665D14